MQQQIITTVRYFYYALGGTLVAQPDAGTIGDGVKRRVRIHVDAPATATLYWHVEAAYSDESMTLPMGVDWKPLEGSGRSTIIDDSDNLALIALKAIGNDHLHGTAAIDVVRVVFWRYVVRSNAALQHLAHFVPEAVIRTYLHSRVHELANAEVAIKAIRDAASDYEADLCHEFVIDDLWTILLTCERVLEDPELMAAIEGVATMATVEPFEQDRHRLVLQLSGLFPERVESLTYPNLPQP
jgi:hypothetical protein